LSLADSSSFLWRWQLYRVSPELGDEWEEVAAHARRHFPCASLAFADLHAALAEAAGGGDDVVQQRIEGLRQVAQTGRLPPGEVAPALCAGMAAWAQGNPEKAARLLESALADLPRIGGSHAQRELFEDTLIAALMQAGEREAAAARLEARLARRPSARDREWLRQCRGDAPS
jgi:hypothetical protein